MTAFKPGDRVLVRATVSAGQDYNGDLYLRSDLSRRGFYATPRDLELISEPERTDPELIPGMVVAPKDEADQRRWWVRDALYGGLLFAPASAMPSGPRRDLPAEIRVVFDPREATS